MGIRSGDYAHKHFPRRHWEAGERALLLADFSWEDATSRMLYTGYTLRYGERLARPDETHQPTSTRLYTLEKLKEILRDRGMEVVQAIGGYDLAIPATEDTLTLLVHSRKERM